MKIKTDKYGFTLLELIIVCFLIGIMLAVAVPSVHTTLFANSLKSSARKIIGLVGEARELAVRMHQPYIIHINQNENTLWYVKEADQEKDDDKDKVSFTLPEDVEIKTIWVNREELSSQDQVTIWINKQGYMNRVGLDIEDDDTNMLHLQFYTFLDSPTITEEFVSQ